MTTIEELRNEIKEYDAVEKYIFSSNQEKETLKKNMSLGDLLRSIEHDERCEINSVNVIRKWWLTQRKKMFKKPTKSANKTQH
jgi:hypothetical protein